MNLSETVISSMVLTVLAASLSFSLSCVIKVTSLSPACLINLLFMMVEPVTVVMPVLLCINAGLGRVVVAEVRNFWALGVFGLFLGAY